MQPFDSSNLHLKTRHLSLWGSFGKPGRQAIFRLHNATNCLKNKLKETKISNWADWRAAWD